MSKHPNEDWKINAKAKANKSWSQKDHPELWLQEYRDAYAKNAGIDVDDIPIEIDADLQAFLTELDDRIAKLKAEVRTKLREAP